MGITDIPHSDNTLHNKKRIIQETFTNVSAAVGDRWVVSLHEQGVRRGSLSIQQLSYSHDTGPVIHSKQVSLVTLGDAIADESIHTFIQV